MNTVLPDTVREIVARFPTTRDENWKYTDLSRAREIAARWLDAGARQPVAATRTTIERISSHIDATWFVIANGRLQGLPDTDGIEASRIDSLPDADSALDELNAALLVDGLRIDVVGEPGKPIGLLFLDAPEETSVTQGYVELAVAANGACDVIEYHVSSGDIDHYANTAVSLSVGDNAALRHVRVQCRAPTHVQTGRTTVSVGRNATFNSAGFDLGGGLIRNDFGIDISNPGAEVAFDGLYLAGDGQHIDNHTRIDHRAGPATSRQEYRGILNGKCRCVWNGKAIVHEGADGTDADQANHNLLLSARAEIDAKPELEIYTDDVKCSHGTTVGQLDETALFYLRSRGLDRDHATHVLMHAFAAGLVIRAPVKAARAAVSQLVEARLADLIRSDEEFSL